MNQPPRGFCTDVDVIKIKDGDTLRVQFRRQFDVRLYHPNKEKLIFDTPEKDTEKGQQAKQYVQDLYHTEACPTCGKQSYHTGRLFIPAKKNITLMDINSFSRIVGAMWHIGKRLTQKIMDVELGRLVKRNERTTKPWPWEIEPDGLNRNS